MVVVGKPELVARPDARTLLDEILPWIRAGVDLEHRYIICDSFYRSYMDARRSLGEALARRDIERAYPLIYDAYTSLMMGVTLCPEVVFPPVLSSPSHSPELSIESARKVLRRARDEVAPEHLEPLCSRAAQGIEESWEVARQAFEKPFYDVVRRQLVHVATLSLVMESACPPE